MGRKRSPAKGSLHITGVDEDTGKPVSREAVEDAGVAFDPESQHLDLSKEEKRRTTALMMAIQAYKNLLIPDAAYLEKAADLARRGEGPKIHAGTIDAMVVAALKFDAFIAGEAKLQQEPQSEPEKPSMPETPATE